MLILTLQLLYCGMIGNPATFIARRNRLIEVVAVVTEMCNGLLPSTPALRFDPAVPQVRYKRHPPPNCCLVWLTILPTVCITLSVALMRRCRWCTCILQRPHRSVNKRTWNLWKIQVCEYVHPTPTPYAVYCYCCCMSWLYGVGLIAYRQPYRVLICYVYMRNCSPYHVLILTVIYLFLII